MKTLVVAMVILSTANVGASEISQACQDRRNYIVKQRSESVSVDQLMTTVLKAKRPMLLMGEIHGGPRLDSYKRMFPTIRKQAPQLECLVLESYSPNNQSVFDAFNRGDDSLIQKTDWNKEDLEAFAYVRSLGVRIYPIDADAHDVLFQKGTGPWMDVRNQFFVQKIHDLLNSKTCSGVMMSLGYKHLTSWNHPNGLPSLEERLSAAGIESNQILYFTPSITTGMFAKKGSAVVDDTWGIESKKTLVVTGEEGKSTSFMRIVPVRINQMRKEDLLCSAVPALPKQDLGFLRTTEVDAPIGYDFQSAQGHSEGNFSEFDGVIVFAAHSQFHKLNETLYDRLKTLGVDTY